MQYGKLLMYLGLSLIWTGVVLRVVQIEHPVPMWFFIVGGLTKAVYLYMAYRRGVYKPGAELYFLAAGLAVLMFGVVLRNSHPESTFGMALIAKAVVLKAIFVFMVIRKMREYRLNAIVVATKEQATDKATG